MAGEHAAQDAGALACVPTGHVVAVKAQEAAPWALNRPAAQGRHAAEELAALANVPAGHVVAVKAQEVAPWVLNPPAAHAVQAALEEAPVAADQVPAGQGVASKVDRGQ